VSLPPSPESFDPVVPPCDPSFDPESLEFPSFLPLAVVVVPADVSFPVPGFWDVEFEAPDSRFVPAVATAVDAPLGPLFSFPYDRVPVFPGFVSICLARGPTPTLFSGPGREVSVRPP
jgi:hypothetical protein